MRRVVVGVVVVAVLALVGFGIAFYANRDPNQGWDTTCGNFLKMTPAQRSAVMRRAGVQPQYLEERAQWYADACAPHPEARDYPIGDIHP